MYWWRANPSYKLDPPYSDNPWHVFFLSAVVSHVDESYRQARIAAKGQLYRAR